MPGSWLSHPSRITRRTCRTIDRNARIMALTSQPLGLACGLVAYAARRATRTSQSLESASCATSTLKPGASKFSSRAAPLKTPTGCRYVVAVDSCPCLNAPPRAHASTKCTSMSSSTPLSALMKVRHLLRSPRPSSSPIISWSTRLRQNSSGSRALDGVKNVWM